ncbi:hypothetical protein J1N35_023791 [Gossypium stocksii]|uniref:Reverse transcriptase n=1 Tax=Gossypium stocksii TaxID=47602 RepID=A0A9D3VIR8_9ROSI|nr:hypothetical protein J1N35_023791 [Gossypium stocksii]
MEKVRLKCGFENGIDIGAMGTRGGLSLGWKGNSLVYLRSFSSFHIDVDIRDNECGDFWRLTGFYGNSEEKNRRKSWELLRQLSHDQAIPWVVLRDFNEILEHLSHSFSDHCPILLDTVGKGKKVQCFTDKAFRFEAKWCLDASFEELIKKWWTECSGNVPVRLQSLNYQIQRWSKNSRQEEWKIRGRITELEDGDGRRMSSNEEMLKLAAKFFSELFSASEMGLDEHVFELVEKRVTDDMNDSLIAQFTVEEIESAIKSMAFLHAPEIDRFPVEKPTNLTQFRPISLCNVVFKIVAKTLVKMMSSILGHCIDDAQGAFIPGRLISDNVLVTYEVLHCLKMRKTGKNRNFALKLDMSKAYYRVEWDFLADDSILFGDASCEGARVIRDVIREYEIISGQRVNFNKSLLYFGANVDSSVKDNIVNLLGARVATNSEKYLGLPMMVGRKKAWAFANFVDKFRKRVDGWKFRYLSIGGKEVFIKSVLQAIPLYAMQYFLMPKSLCHKLECIMNKFWWTNNKTATGIHWSTWDFLCRPKCVGGMGFKNLVLFNNENWVLPLFTWRSICSVRKLLAEGLVWRVGNGSRINLWNDPWLPGRENNRLSVQRILPNWTYVNQLIDAETNIWNNELIHNLVDEDTASRIISIPLSGANDVDMIVWKYEGSREYTVKSGYRAFFIEWLQKKFPINPNEIVQHNFYKALWSLSIPEKIKIHIWRLFNNLLPHFCNLAKRSLCTEIVCPLCKVAPENADHLLWSCGILQSVWALLQIKFPSIEEITCCKLCFLHTFLAADEQQKNVMAVSIWGLWYRRNKLVHEGLKFSLQELIGFVHGYCRDLNLSQENLCSTNRSKIIVRDSEAGIRGAEIYLLTDVADACVAEARACKRALLFAVERGYRRLIVEGDSLTVIKNVKKKETDRSVLRPITQQICDLKKVFRRALILVKVRRYSVCGFKALFSSLPKS